MQIRIQNHSELDKFFTVSTNHLSMKIDCDDVNHAEVDAAVAVMKEIMETHWDEILFQTKYKECLRKMGG